MIDKQYIIEKASVLFKRNGLKNTTMDDLAAEIGISKKTIYQHVCDRNELVNDVISSEYIKLATELKDIIKSSMDIIDELININIMIFKFLNPINSLAVSDLKKQYPEIYLASKEKFSALFAGLLKDNLNNGIKTELYRNDIDVDVIVGIHSDRIEKLQSSNDLYEASLTASETIKQMINYYIRGLVTNEGQITLEQHIVNFDKYLG